MYSSSGAKRERIFHLAGFCGGAAAAGGHTMHQKREIGSDQQMQKCGARRQAQETIVERNPFSLYYVMVRLSLLEASSPSSSGRNRPVPIPFDALLPFSVRLH